MVHRQQLERKAQLAHRENEDHKDSPGSREMLVYRVQMEHMGHRERKGLPAPRGHRGHRV